jgi:hypothetical protein
LNDIATAARPCQRCGARVALLSGKCMGCGAKRLGPQPGPQEKFLACSADIALYGGSANSGKSVCLLLDVLGHAHNPLWNGLLLRRHAKDFKDKGSIYEKAKRLFAGTGARFRAGEYMDVTWPSGASLAFRHLDDANMQGYQGPEYAWIGFDEITHFEMSWVRYLMTRMRTSAGVRPSMRMTCNPDPDHEIAQWVDPWYLVDPPSGRPNVARSGVPRFLAVSRETDALVWGNTRAECAELAGRPPNEVKSFTYIAASPEDNAIGMIENPDYASSLAMAGRVEEARLRGGDWRVRVETGGMLRREWWGGADGTMREPLAQIVRRVRSWDKAASKPKPSNKHPDFTAGIMVAWDIHGRWYVTDLVICRAEPDDVDVLMEETAERDGASVTHVIQFDPAAAGKFDERHTRKVLGSSGVCGPIVTVRPLKDKVVRVQPVSKLLRDGMTGKAGEWKPIGYILNTGWMQRPYSDGGPAAATVGGVFWQQIAKFWSGDPADKDDIPDALAAALEVGNMPQTEDTEDEDPVERLLRMS